MLTLRNRRRGSREVRVSGEQPIRLEAQRSATDVARVRRLIFTFSGRKAADAAFGIAALVIVRRWSFGRSRRAFHGFPVDASRRENRALRAQQEALREHAFDLAGRLAASVERGVGSPGWLAPRICLAGTVPPPAGQRCRGRGHPRLALGGGDTAGDDRERADGGSESSWVLRKPSPRRRRTGAG